MKSIFSGYQVLSLHDVNQCDDIECTLVTYTVLNVAKRLKTRRHDIPDFMFTTERNIDVTFIIEGTI